MNESRKLDSIWTNRDLITIHLFKALGLPNETRLAKRGFDTSLYDILSL